MAFSQIPMGFHDRVPSGDLRPGRFSTHVQRTSGSGSSAIGASERSQKIMGKLEVFEVS